MLTRTRCSVDNTRNPHSYYVSGNRCSKLTYSSNLLINDIDRFLGETAFIYVPSKSHAAIYKESICTTAIQRGLSCTVTPNGVIITKGSMQARFEFKEPIVNRLLATNNNLRFKPLKYMKELYKFRGNRSVKI